MPHKKSATPCGIAPVLALAAMAVPNQYELMIYGDIGESWWEETVSAANVVAQLDALPPNVNQIHMRVNSFGGSVPDGLAIYNALKRTGATVTGAVEGVAASIASFILMAASEVRMPATSVMMVHDPRVAFVEDANASKLRSWADMLDVWGAAMAEGYAAKTGLSVDEVKAQLLDGADHFYSGTDAVAAGLADVLEDFDATVSGDEPSLSAVMPRFVASAPAHIRKLIASAVLGATAPSTSTQRAATSAPTGAAHMPNPSQAVVAEPAADVAAITAQTHAALRARNDEIKAILEPYMKRDGVAALYTAALVDPALTVEDVRAKLLPILGAASEPAGSTMHVEMGTTEGEKIRVAAESILLARAGVIKGADAERARQGNPFARSNLISMAEHFLIRAGAQTRDMSRDEIARRALAAGGQSTSDFPVLLENLLNKTLIGGYNLASFTWTRFCATGTLSDYRPHGRYHLSSFSDLKAVNEAGEYENGVLGDAQKEVIQGQRKGRILQITPEVLINDDLGGITRIAGALGQAAGRTIEKDVYALFALNGGYGPTMQDGKPLFDAAHKNIAGAGGPPSVAAFDALRQLLGAQQDPGGNDYLDITAAVWLGPLSLGGTARVVNEAQYDVDVNNKFQVPNKSRGMFRDVVDTPRLGGTAWYGLADAGIEPVIEVAFLDGVQTPTLEQETNFRTDGLAWKAVHRYGVAAVGWRGAVLNKGQ